MKSTIYLHVYQLADTPRNATQYRIRLVGGNNRTEGRVEITTNGTWGTICDDNWDLNDATVVCRQLGFDGADEAVSYAQFGQGTGPIYLDEVACFGNELTLADCFASPLGRHDCRHFEDAGVRCHCKLLVCTSISLVHSHW